MTPGKLVTVENIIGSAPVWVSYDKLDVALVGRLQSGDSVILIEIDAVVEDYAYVLTPGGVGWVLRQKLWPDVTT